MPQPESVHAETLLEYLGVARRRWWIIFLTVAIAVTGAYLIAKNSIPVYQAQAEVLLRGATVSTGQANQAFQTNSATVATELRVVAGSAVRQAVVKTLPNAPQVSRAVSTSTSSFSVTTRSTSPQLAAAAANAYVSAYIDQRRLGALHDLLAVTDQLQTKVSDLQRQIDALGPPAVTPTNVIRVPSQADVQRSVLVNQQANYRITLSDLQSQAGSVSGGAEVLSPAKVPTSPVAPQPVRTAGEAAVAGLIVGLGLAFFVEHLDNTIKSADRLDRISGGLPLVGIIPVVQGWRDRNQARVVTRAAPNSPVSEAYRSLRTSLHFVGLDRPISVYHVTSPASKEGKSTTVVNFGMVLAQVGDKVVIVDLDLRRPRVHDFFELPNDTGFTSVVLGEAPMSDALQEVPGTPGLSILSAGPVPTSPSELLSSNRAAAVVRTLRDSGWTVVLDSPPLLPVSDALVVSKMADATLLVISAGLTKTAEMKRALELLQQVHAPLVGFVLNRAPALTPYSYGSHSYSSNPTTNDPAPSSLGSAKVGKNEPRVAKRPLKKVSPPVR